MNDQANTPQPQELDPVKPELNTLTILKPRPFRRLVSTIGNLPTVFVESLSLTEMLAYIQSYLENTVIPAVNDNAAAVAELQAFVVKTMNEIITEVNNFETQVKADNEVFQAKIEGMQTAFEEVITNKQTTFENTITEQQTNFQNSITTQQSTFETTIDGKITTLQNQFAALKEYCENYLNNLDYQTVIENKFDELVSDGTVEGWVTSKLGEHPVYGFKTIADFEQQIQEYDDRYPVDTVLYFGGVDSLGQLPGAFIVQTRATGIVYDGKNNIALPEMPAVYLKRIDPEMPKGTIYGVLWGDQGHANGYQWLNKVMSALLGIGEKAYQFGDSRTAWNVSNTGYNVSSRVDVLISQHPDITDLLILVPFSATSASQIETYAENMQTQIQTIQSTHPDVNIHTGYIPDYSMNVNFSLRKLKSDIVAAMRAVCDTNNVLWLNNMPYGYNNIQTATHPAAFSDQIARNLISSLKGIPFFATINLTLANAAVSGVNVTQSSATLVGYQLGDQITVRLSGTAVWKRESGESILNINPEFSIPTNNFIMGTGKLLTPISFQEQYGDNGESTRNYTWGYNVGNLKLTAEPASEYSDTSLILGNRRAKFKGVFTGYALDF